MAEDWARQLAVFGESLRVLSQLIEGVSDERLRRIPAPGEWSAHIVVCHLVPDEMNTAVTLRLILTTNDPVRRLRAQSDKDTTFEQASGVIEIKHASGERVYKTFVCLPDTLDPRRPNFLRGGRHAMIAAIYAPLDDRPKVEPRGPKGK
jgi:hypothetical protein